MDVLNQVLILFIFGIIGYSLCKFNLVSPAHSKLLSTLLVYVFLPSNILKTFSTNFTIDYIKEKYILLILSATFVTIVGIIAHFVSKLFSKNKYEQRLYEYSLVVPNYGYMGYALADSLLGSAGLLNAIVFGAPMSVYIYTYGFASLTKRGLSFKKLLNPVIVALLLGMILGLSKAPIPEVLTSALVKSSSCMGPTSMLLAGMTVSQFKILDLLTSYKAYIVTFLRLIALPLVVGWIIKIFFGLQIAQVAVLICSMPCGLNAVVFPKLVDENCEIGARLAFLSNIFACLTIPLIFYIFSIK